MKLKETSVSFFLVNVFELISINPIQSVDNSSAEALVFLQ